MDTISLPVVDSFSPQKTVKKQFVPNPMGQGGFGDHPENAKLGGRPPKEWTFKQLLRDALEEYRDIKNKSGDVIARKQAKKLVIERLIGKAAREGDMRAVEIILDRIDGKVMQKVDHTTDGEKIEMPILYIPEEKK